MHKLTKESEWFNKGCVWLGAIDEAGRGPLAGPVVAACVLIEPSFIINDPLLKLVNDSKKLSPAKREQLADVIYREIPAIGLGIADATEIDRSNILQATFLAMKRAVACLSVQPEVILVDGNQAIPGLGIDQEKIINGDGLVFSIAAASIIAKVERDKLMQKWHETYPEYGFDKHKGYGTKLHMEQLSNFGPSPIHRRSFAPVAAAVVKAKKIIYT